MRSVRSKIFSGVLFLSLIIVTLIVLAVIFINQLAQNSKGTIVDNYRTIDYSMSMLESLNEMYYIIIESKNSSLVSSDSLNLVFNKARTKFENNLTDEISNITEQGEKELVTLLQKQYKEFQNEFNKRNINRGAVDIVKSYSQLRSSIQKIYSLNMSSILKKNSDVEVKARQVITYTIIAGGLSVLITLFFILTFHGQIVKPLEERDAAKTKLISTVSHEMKTPISSINLTLKLLEDSRVGSLNKEQTELVQSIKDQNNRLSRVINEILNYSQIESGNIRLNFNYAQPEDILDYAATALMIMLSEKNIQLETKIEEHLPSINIDIEKTVWVLVNLLNNAIRYSEQSGKIIISAGRKEDSVFFSVKDFGPGITEENQKKLFSRFTQLGNKTERGWGLGLAIAKEFVQAQGGSIKVSSKAGGGSEFTFYLPCH
jgi:two-component system, NtrC family, sensor histidine kinase KinB